MYSTATSNIRVKVGVAGAQENVAPCTRGFSSQPTRRHQGCENRGMQGFDRRHVVFVLCTPSVEPARDTSVSQIVMRLKRCNVLLAAIGVTAWTGCGADEAPDFSGAELYGVFCASCHGVDAHGDGPVAPAMKTKVPDLTRIAARNGGVFPAEQVRQSIDGQKIRPAHGARDMPVWGWEFYAMKGEDAARRKRVAELIARLVDHLGSIQRR